jgi:hypothetical protein
MYNCCWPLPAQSSSGPSPVVLVAIFYCLRFETSIFVASYDSQGHGGGIRPRLHTGIPAAESEFYVTTDRQPASLSWNKAPIWGLRPDLYYSCDSYGLVLVGHPLWREVGSVFCMCCGPLPAQFSRVQFPWDLRPHFTVSDLRLPFSSPPTTRRVTVEVMPAVPSQVSLYNLGSDRIETPFPTVPLLSLTWETCLLSRYRATDNV